MVKVISRSASTICVSTVWPVDRGRWHGIGAKDRSTRGEESRRAARCRRAASSRGGLCGGDVAAGGGPGRTQTSARALLLQDHGRPLPGGVSPQGGGGIAGSGDSVGV